MRKKNSDANDFGYTHTLDEELLETDVRQPYIAEILTYPTLPTLTASTVSPHLHSSLKFSFANFFIALQPAACALSSTEAIAILPNPFFDT